MPLRPIPCILSTIERKFADFEIDRIFYPCSSIKKKCGKNNGTGLTSHNFGEFQGRRRRREQNKYGSQ